MVRAETAEMIAGSRLVTAQALFEGRADLNGYPFQLLGVVSQRGTGMENVSAVLAGAEMLLPYGWELVNVSEFTSSEHACAVMRRRVSG
ncbi:transcriptional regulator [Actinoplanes sp. NPDC051346]|uniref:transcriptional regulator n=1 Tax=Actinoplanes sp. NPDC051346 TaxID=3155048 RepID=UPI003416CFF9